MSSYECKHERFDFTKTGGPGFIACADCKKSIPVERALLSLDRRLARLERFLFTDTLMSKEAANEP